MMVKNSEHRVGAQVQGLALIADLARATPKAVQDAVYPALFGLTYQSITSEYTLSPTYRRHGRATLAGCPGCRSPIY